VNYRCPHCQKPLNVAKLFFSDVSRCKECHQRVMLGDFFAFFMAAVSMLVMALSSLYLLTVELQSEVVAGGYALSIGMVTGIVVLLLLGRASPYKGYRTRASGHARTPAH
jgi:DNA-directed RNA polymerase subunit RPC12/RpoP